MLSRLVFKFATISLDAKLGSRYLFTETVSDSIALFQEVVIQSKDRPDPTDPLYRFANKICEQWLSSKP